MKHVEVLRELPARWRASRRAYDGSADDALADCADELDAAIAALSAPHPPAEAQEPRDRESDRARFRDEAFNAWLDTVISDAGHTVWDTIGDLADAWAGWQARPDAPPSAPVGVEAALRDALQGLLDFIEIDNLPMDADAMFIAKRALAQQGDE